MTRRPLAFRPLSTTACCCISQPHALPAHAEPRRFLSGFYPTLESLGRQANLVRFGGDGAWAGCPQLVPAHSRRVRWFLHVSQHADHEPQQLLQRVEARHLARDQMLDAAVIGRRGPGGLGAKLDHKDPIRRERRLRLGHSRSPVTPRRCMAFSRCPFHDRNIESGARSWTGPKCLNVRSKHPRSVKIVFKYCSS